MIVSLTNEVSYFVYCEKSGTLSQANVMSWLLEINDFYYFNNFLTLTKQVTRTTTKTSFFSRYINLSD